VKMRSDELIEGLEWFDLKLQFLVLNWQLMGLTRREV
jgi:hypothetical protein